MLQRYVNQAAIRGTIVSINITSRDAVVTIVTRKNGIKNYPNVIFREKNIIRNYGVGDNIEVYGYVQNHISFEDMKNDKKHPKTVFIGERVIKAKRLLYDYFPNESLPKGGGHPEDRNEVVFVGKVITTYYPTKGSNVCVVKAESKSKVHKGQCDMICLDYLGYEARRVKQGDWVAMVGYFETKKEKVNGVDVIKTDVVCLDICKIEAPKVEEPEVDED